MGIPHLLCFLIPSPGNPRARVSIYVSRMWRHILIDVPLGALFVAAWYCICLQLNRRKSVRILHWIESTFGSYGSIAGVRWLSASRFRVHLRLANCGFLHSTLFIQLPADELPFNWLLNQLRRKRRQETLTFEADLHCPPGFNLDVQNHRWCGRTRRRLVIDPNRWTIERLGPIVITSRNDWHRDVTNLMNGMLSTRECDFHHIQFRRRSPHFSATMPLSTLAPENGTHIPLLEALRELAEGASASRF